MTAFDKHQVACFRFVRCDFAADTGVAQLVYAFDNGPELVETVSIPGAPFVLDGARAEAVQRSFAASGAATPAAFAQMYGMHPKAVERQLARAAQLQNLQS